MKRWVALAAGAGLVVLAVAAASRVTDTREGLIAEIITLLGGATGLSLLTYAFFARPRPPIQRQALAAQSAPLGAGSPRDLALGIGGILISIVLVAGLGLSGGLLWAVLGFLLLTPMLVGSVFLCWRGLRPRA